MFLLLAVDAQPKQIGPAVMPDAVEKPLAGEDGVEVEVRVNDGFLGLVDVFGELAAVGPEDGATPAPGLPEQRRRARPEEFDRLLGLDARRVQDESLGFDRVRLRERPAS